MNKPIYDVEILGMMALESELPIGERPALIRQVRDALQALSAGLGLSPHLDSALVILDPDLRTRIKEGILIIERYHPYFHGWAYICDWPRHDDGVLYSADECIALLKANDMQRFGPVEWMRRKREAAAKVREANDKLADDRIAAAIDGLSLKQVNRFMAVERAIATGDTIILHDEDERSMERMFEASRNTPPEPNSPYILMKRGSK